MDKETLLKRLNPFIEGKIQPGPKWMRTARRIARKIPNSEVRETADILEEMTSIYLGSQERRLGTPGAHAVYQILADRLVDIEGRG